MATIACPFGANREDAEHLPANAGHGTRCSSAQPWRVRIGRVAHHFGGGQVDLRWARVGTIWDDADTWPQAGNIWLDHFQYHHIHHGAPTDVKRRLEWLRRQPEETGQPFNPQPYEQCAAVLKKMGDESAARQILIAKEEDRAERDWNSMNGPARVWHGLLGSTIAHGYEPWRVWKPMLGIIVLGAVLFFAGRWCSLMQPTSDRAFRTDGNEWKTQRSDYPTFNAIVYSLDEFLPIINLRQGDHWIPNASDAVNDREGFWGFVLRRMAGLLRLYLWCHILAGWVLSTLFVASVTGIIRR